MYIIIKDKESNLRRLKGKGIADLGKNLESEGWPSEFASEEARDKIKFIEKKEGRSLARKDIPNKWKVNPE